MNCHWQWRRYLCTSWLWTPNHRYPSLSISACTVNSSWFSCDAITAILVDINRRFLCFYNQHCYHAFVIWIFWDWLQTINGTVFKPMGTVGHMVKKFNDQPSVNWIGWTVYKLSEVPQHSILDSDTSSKRKPLPCT